MYSHLSGVGFILPQGLPQWSDYAGYYYLLGRLIKSGEQPDVSYLRKLDRL